MAAKLTIAAERDSEQWNDILRVLAINRYEHPVKRVRVKCMALFLIMERPEMENEMVAKLAECHRNSIPSWIRKLNEHGVQSLLLEDMHRNTSDLENIKDKLISKLENEDYLTLKQIRNMVKEDFGMTISEGRLGHHLRKWGFKPRKTGYIPGKADPKEQEKWLDEKLKPVIEEVSKEGAKSHLLFSDACHFVLGAFVAFIWSLCRRFIRSGAGRNRLNVLGAVDTVTKEVFHVRNTDYVNTDTVKELFDLVSARYNGEKVYMVMDNARYQHNESVREYAGSKNIEIIFLPPYSPNLNIIERLWRYIKKKVLYGKYFPSVKEFHAAINGFLDNDLASEECKEELRALLTLKFQTFSGIRDLDDAQNDAV